MISQHMNTSLNKYKSEGLNLKEINVCLDFMERCKYIIYFYKRKNINLVILFLTLTCVIWNDFEPFLELDLI